MSQAEKRNTRPFGSTMVGKVGQKSNPYLGIHCPKLTIIAFPVLVRKNETIFDAFKEDLKSIVEFALA